jgi:hypothetical protein
VAISVVHTTLLSTAGASTLPVTIPATTAGNCLVVAVMAENETGSGAVTGITLGGLADNFGELAASDFDDTSNFVWEDAILWADPGCAGSQTALVVSVNSALAGAETVDVVVFQVSGLPASSVLDKSATNGEDQPASTWTSGTTGATTVADEIWIGACYSSGIIGVPSSPWADSGINADDGDAACGYQIVSSTGTATYSGTGTATTGYAAAVVCLKGAATGPPAPFWAPRKPARGRQAARKGTSAGAQGAPWAYVPPPVASPFYLPAGPARGRPAARKGRSAGAPGAPWVYVPPVPSPFWAPGGPSRGRQAARKGRSHGHPGAPLYIAPPTVVNQWAGTFAQPAAFGTMPPALQGVPVPLDSSTSVGGGSGTAAAGNWLIALVGVNEPLATSQVTVGDADDQHSFWRPGDVWTSTWAVSQADTLSRTSVWYTANTIRQVNTVYVAPNGCCDAISVLVLEVGGLGPWDTITGIYTNYAAAAESLNLTLPAPAARSFLIAAVTGDNDSVSQSFTPAGWTALETVTASNGSDHTCDCVLTSAYITTSGSVSVNGTADSAEDLSGVIIGFQQDAASPVVSGANENWPGRFIAEAAFGAGYETAPDQCTWTVLTDNAWPGTWQPGWYDQFKRLWAWNDRSGIPWGLGQYQTSTGAVTLDNFDGSLSPSNVGGLFYSDALNSNMSFQSGVSPWTAAGGATLAQSAAQVFASAGAGLPQYSLQVTPNGTTAGPGALSEQDAVTASSPYSASGWFYSAAGWSTGAKVAISWYTSASALISTVASSALPIPAGTWTQVTLLNQTSPSNAAYAAVTVQFAGTPSSSAPFWAAEAALAAGATAVSTGQVTAGTPIRLRMALGTIGGSTYDRWYVWARNAQSWPEKRNRALRNFVPATLSDPWQSATGSCPTPYRAEVEQDLAALGPGWWWPADDQTLAGGVLPTSLHNAAAGTTTALSILPASGGVVSQDSYSSGIGFGSGGTDLTSISTSSSPSVATYGVGADAGWMYGDPQVSPQSSQTGNPTTAQPGSAAWQQSGLLGDSGEAGWYLTATDSFPPVAGGITVSGWFSVGFFGSAASIDNEGTYYNVAGQPYSTITLMEMASDGGYFILQLDMSGHLQLDVDGTTHDIYGDSDLRCNAWFRVTVELTPTSYQVWVNGGLTANVSGSCTVAGTTWQTFTACGDNGGNMMISHLTIYPGLLRFYRELAQYSAAVTGCGLIPAPTSVQASAVVNLSPSGFVPDGTLYNGSYGSGGGRFTMSALAVAVAGDYTSGPAARAIIAGRGFGTPSSYGGACWVQWTTLAPLVRVYTADAADVETEASTVLGSGDSYSNGYGSGASGGGRGHVSGGDGSSPPSAASALGDDVQTRLERILGYGSITVPMRAIDPAPEPVQAALDVGGQQTGASVTAIQQSDSGWFFYDNAGVANYRDRPHLNADTVSWLIGMNTAGGYLPFAGDVTPDNDPQRVFTAITVVPYSPDGASLPELVPAAYATANAAQAQYGPRSLSLSSYLQSATAQQSQANWLLTYYGTLRKRIAVITIDAATHPAAWGLVLGLNLSDLIQVNDQPLGAPATTTTYRVSSISRTLAFGGNGSEVAARLVITADPVTTYWS